MAYVTGISLAVHKVCNLFVKVYGQVSHPVRHLCTGFGQMETVETETGNGKMEIRHGNGQNLMQMNARVKPFNDF